MIRVAVAGVAGRMGKTLVQAIMASESLTFTAGFEHADHPQIGDDVGTVCGIGLLNVVLSADPSQHASDFDVVIDFACASYHGYRNTGYPRENIRFDSM